MSLFNPTLLLFLALLLLVSGLLLFYMDMKMREQNNKIKAIADLATTIAQSIKGGNVSSNDNSNSNSNNNSHKELNRENIQLIQVSDDEDDDDADDDDDDEDSESDDSSSSDDDDDDEDDDDEGEQDEQKETVKLNIHDTDSDIKHVFLSQEQLTEAKEEPAEVEASVVELESQEAQEAQEAQVNPPSEAETDLDTFKIVLSSELDYKKMSIQKLRQLVSEKGLAPSSETSKMKKPELLKLLETE
jgi:hypothetical protein